MCFEFANKIALWKPMRDDYNQNKNFRAKRFFYQTH